MRTWKYPLLLLSGIGISNLGSWIYLVAINLSILELTGYATLFQNQVPIHMMRRFGSVADMVQGLTQVGLTLFLGLCAEWFSHIGADAST